MMAENTEVVADPSLIRADLEWMTARWPELNVPAMMEIRAFKEHSQPQTAKFSPDWMDEAVEWCESMNRLGYNIYAVRNPIRHDITGSAKDTDIIGAFFLWSDCDDPVSAGNVYRFQGPKWSAAVTTGTVPSVRVHTYWSLEEPITDMAEWRAMQEKIASHFGSDASVVNASRIMRVGGTVSYPAKHKLERGYVKELSRIRTEYNEDRPAVTLDQMRRVFGSYEPAAPRSEASNSFQFDAGTIQTLDRERMLIQAMEGKEWHNAVIRLVGSYVSRGLSDTEIHALTDPLTLSGYTVDQTRKEVQVAIDGARAKGWTPEPQEPPASVQFDAEAAEWPTLYELFDETAIAPRQWIYANHYLRSFVSVLASAGGIGKTSLQIVEALAIVTGKPLLGEIVREPCNVWIINLEDPLEEMQRRILAAMKFYNIQPDEVRGKLFVDAGRDFNITFAAQTREGIIPNDALVKHMIKRIPERNIGCVFIDPFVGAHEVNENDNTAMNAVVAKIRDVADSTKCAIGLVHHVRKGNGQDADIDSVRGAGSLIGAARAARVINKVSEDDAIRLGVPHLEARGIFRVDDGKANLAPPAASAVYRKMEGVQIANGEWVGVATPFELPDGWAGMTDDVVNNILALIDAGPEVGELYSARPQDKERWCGNVIMDYQFPKAADNKSIEQAKIIVKEWLKTGLLKETEFHSEAQRKTRKGVRSTDTVGAKK